MSKLAENWKMTHTGVGSNYVLTCKNDKFIEKKMSVKVPCSGQVMTDDLYVEVEAKAGSITLTGSDISATLSLDYSTDKVSISGGTATIKPTITEGWIASGEPKTIGASGSYTIPMADGNAKYFEATSSNESYWENNKYYKSFYIYAVDNQKLYINGSSSSVGTVQGNYKVFNFNPRTEIVMAGDDHGNHYCRLGIEDTTNFSWAHTTKETGWVKPKYTNVSGTENYFCCFTNCNSGDTLYCYSVTGNINTYEQSGYHFKFELHLSRVATNEDLTFGYYYTNDTNPSISMIYDQEGASGSSEHCRKIYINPTYKYNLAAAKPRT